MCCRLTLAQGEWRENGSYLVRRHVHTRVPMSVISLVWFAKLVFLPDSDIYSLSGLFTGLQENVKYYELQNSVFVIGIS